MPAERHVHLLVEYRDGRPCREPVHVLDPGGGRFRLLHSPGFVLGIAAGDEFRLLGEDGSFEVLSRSGNVAVQVFSRESIEPLVGELTRRVPEIGGILDGRIERGMVFTIPIGVGFPTIEEVFDALVSAHPGLEWLYGNIYHPSDGVTPLNGWIDAP
jgi:hypothetical protein